jgi:3-phenylpropionate/trans-cinnamate dioxygenase ferredoxin reductase component
VTDGAYRRSGRQYRAKGQRMSGFVIVGAALAGAKTAQALREQGFAGPITLIGAEGHLPYERPELSKGYLAGSTAREKVFVHDRDWYAAHDIELRLGVRVTAIDRAAHQVTLDDGSVVDYDKLMLTPGASPREPSLPGADAAGVHYLRTIDDSDALRAVIASVQKLVVIGAGWIGLEVTAAARNAGVEVTVVESAALPLLRVLGPELAEVFAALHREHGVDFRFGATVEAITAVDGRATGLQLADGTLIPGDAVLIAVGAGPNVELATAAGLEVDNGIVVDAGLRTSDPDIFAAGDVANALNPLYGKHIRVEHWANALNQPATGAASMLGADASYAEVPYFYTDQYDLGMEYLGYVEPGGYDQVIFRGDLGGREFIAFWLAGGKVIAGMNVNVWDVTDPIKAIIRSGLTVEVDALANLAVSLESLVP